jgi:hypothetical protein
MFKMSTSQGMQPSEAFMTHRCSEILMQVLAGALKFRNSAKPLLTYRVYL